MKRQNYVPILIKCSNHARYLQINCNFVMESAGYKTLLYIARMNQKEFEEKISLLEEQVQTLQEANHKLQEQANMLQ